MARLPLTKARTVASARTVPTYPRTPLGGVYIPGAKSIEASTGDTATTSDNTWIENEKFGWVTGQTATAWSAEFDTAVTRTGLKTLKMSTTNTTGSISIYNDLYTQPTGTRYTHLTKIKPSTAYVFSCWVKTTNVPVNGCYIQLVEKNLALGNAATNNTNQLSGTNDWTLLTVSFTSAATSAFAALRLRMTIAGNVCDMWFDVNSMTLIETGKVRNPAT